MKKIFTFLLVFLPIISVYKSPIPGVDFGTFCFICISPIIVVTTKKVYFFRENKALAIFLLYIMISTVLSIFVQQSIDNQLMIFRLCKFIFLILLVLYFGLPYLFDYNFAIKALKIITILASIYLLMQVIAFYFTGIILPNAFYNLLITEDQYTNISYYAALNSMYRPSAFFVEPSYFFYYVVLYLIIALFDKRDIKTAILVTISIFGSTSGQGIILTILIWGWWCFENYFENMSLSKIVKASIIFFFFIIGVLFIIKIPIIEEALSRVFALDNNLGGNAIIARISGFRYYATLDSIYKYIGIGYGNPMEGIYFNSVAYILYCCGLIGIALLFYVFYVHIKESKNYSRIFLILYFISLFISLSFIAYYICFYFAFIYTVNVYRKNGLVRME